VDDGRTLDWSGWGFLVRRFLPRGSWKAGQLPWKAEFGSSGREIWDDFRESRRSGLQVSCQMFKIVESGTDARINFNSEFILMFETVLEVAKEATSARDGECHAAKLAKYSMPLFEGNPSLAF
jgi:hypothetical protein